MHGQLKILFSHEPSPAEVCMMCHFSSECGNCCAVCDDRCNGSQICQRGVPGQVERLDSWLYIVRENKGFDHLKKYLVEH